MAIDPQAEQVWNNTFKNPHVLRGLDCCGAEIHRDAYGQRGDYGWEIDHRVPVSRGGGDYFLNLRPLHWENNVAKGNNLDAQWICAVGSRKGYICLPNSEAVIFWN